MGVVRIAVASTPLTATLAEAVPAAVEAVEAAGRAGAAIVCLPETAVPGHRCQAQPVPDFAQAQLVEAAAEVADAARRAGVVTILGTEQAGEDGREIVALVLDRDGTLAGVQAKTQIDPSEERWYVPASGRHVFEAGGARFGIAICHEVFRYPEVARALALAGAQIVFVPHWVVTDDGTLPARWCDAANPYHERALACRALENTVYVAAANCSGPDQGSASCVITPDGTQLAAVPYGETGLAVADVDLARATRLLALRWAPERNRMATS